MRTVVDNMDNLNRNVVVRHSEVMGQTINAFGSANLTNLAQTSGTNAVHSSYLGLFSISAPFYIQFVLAGIILLLLALIIALNVKFKSFSMLKVMLGVVIQVVAVAAGALFVFVLYSVMALMLAGFGVISIQAFITFSLFNPGVLIATIILFALAAVAVYIPLKKAFFVKSPSVIRGGVFVTAILAVLTAFIMPQIAYIFTTLSLMQLVIMFVTLIFKNKFKEKFDMDIEKLFLYAWASIITVPMAIAVIILVGTLTPLIMLPVLVLIFAPLLAVILPYAEMLKPIFVKVFNKLPSQVVKTEELVTEMVEDAAKKGKFVEKTYKKVTKEKVKWQYRHHYGVILASLFAFVGMILFSSFGGGFNSKINSNIPDIESYFRVGAFNYVDDAGTRRLEVGDLSTIRDISRYVGGLSFNNSLDAYTKAVPGGFAGVTSPPSFEAVNYGFRYRAFSNQSRVTVTISNAAHVSRIFIGNTTAQLTEENAFILENIDNAPTIRIILPYAFGPIIQFIFEGGAHVGIRVLEESNQSTGLPIFDLADIQTLRNSRVSNYIRFNTIFTTATSVSGGRAV